MSFHEVIHPVATGLARPALAALVAGSVVLTALLLVYRGLQGLSASARSRLLFTGLLVVAVPFHFGFLALNAMLPATPAPDTDVPTEQAMMPDSGSEEAAVDRDWECPAATLVMTGWVVGILSIVRHGIQNRPWIEARATSAKVWEWVESLKRSMSVPEPVAVVECPGVRTPSVVGIARPVILLPTLAADHLDDPELRSVLAHEMAHVARKDNLKRLIEAMVATFLWFNPLVWVVRNRSDLERERACDEMAVSLEAGPQPLLRALFKLCSGTVVAHDPAISCVSGSKVGARIDALTKPPSLDRLPLAVGGGILLFTAALALASAGLVGPPALGSAPESGYGFRLRATRENDAVLLIMQVRNSAGRILVSPRLNAIPSGEAMVSASSGDLDMDIAIRFISEESGEARLIVTRSGRNVADIRRKFVVERALPTQSPTESGRIEREDS